MCGAAERSSYHNESGGDGVIAAVAQLSKLGPVVLLAEQLPVLLIVPVGQGGTALTASSSRGGRNTGQSTNDMLRTKEQHHRPTHGENFQVICQIVYLIKCVVYQQTTP